MHFLLALLPLYKTLQWSYFMNGGGDSSWQVTHGVLSKVSQKHDTQQVHLVTFSTLYQLPFPPLAHY